MINLEELKRVTEQVRNIDANELVMLNVLSSNIDKYVIDMLIRASDELVQLKADLEEMSNSRPYLKQFVKAPEDERRLDTDL